MSYQDLDIDLNDIDDDIDAGVSYKLPFYSYIQLFIADD